jgi:putative NADH-flavin reductase
MRIAVFGAGGRIGRLVVEKALGHGHDVLAAIHKAPLELEHDRLARRQGDVRDLAFVRGVVEGADAVAFAISSAGGGRAHVHEDGIASVVQAMAEHDVSRLAVVSAAGTFARTDRRLSLAYRAWIATAMRATYDDLEAMERRVMATGLAWTIVRPYGLTDDPPTGHYRVSLDGSLLPKASRIPRGDVASLLVKALETDTYYRRAVAVAI